MHDEAPNSFSLSSLSPFIKTQVSLTDKNWFRTGGPASFFAEPATAREFADALFFAQKNNLPVFVLGEGANILVSDQGFDGLVIRPVLHQISIISNDTHSVLVRAGAGVTIHALIEWCLEHNLVGLEEFSGIPGTVGGSVYINLHYFEFLLEHFLVEGEVINKATGELMCVPLSWFEFGYDFSRLHAGDYYLISATFKVRKATPLETAFAAGRRTEIIRHRVKRYPSKNTCGSFFRNFHEHEVTLESNGRKMIFVAYYLDKIGVKGQLQRGNAIVSWQHANMIVNQGNATTKDILDVAQEMQRLVYEQFEVLPQPECQLIGFEHPPLL